MSRPRKATFDILLQKCYNPISFMKKYYPKAAKKRRVLKKWINRFGPDLDLSNFIYNENPLLKAVKDGSGFSGAYIPVLIKFTIKS